MYYWYDSTYVLVIIGLLLSLFASFGVKATFAKYKKVQSWRGLTGADVARRILDAHGLQGVGIEHISGDLTDHFDPRSNVVRLSDATYSDTSVAAIGVAAHETGHAIQHAEAYAPIKVRNSMVPAVNICNTLSMPMFIIGLILGMTNLALVGVVLFSATLLFQIVTLPVEFNASNRALNILYETGMLEPDELKGSKKVLRAAGMTYVAAAAATALQVLRLLLIVGGRRRD